MPEYVVTFPADNEAEWETGTLVDHQSTFETDNEFAKQLKTIGGAIQGGAALSL